MFFVGVGVEENERETTVSLLDLGTPWCFRVSMLCEKLINHANDVAENDLKQACRWVARMIYDLGDWLELQRVNRCIDCRIQRPDTGVDCRLKVTKGAAEVTKIRHRRASSKHHP